MTAQRASLDTLDSVQLHQKMADAIKTRDLGRTFVIVPPVLGALAGLGILSHGDESDEDFLQYVIDVLLLYTIAIVGIPMMATGAVLWATGSKRINRIDIALKKFNLPPQNSMALGVGITINFRF